MPTAHQPTDTVRRLIAALLALFCLSGPLAAVERFPIYPNATYDAALSLRGIEQAKRFGVAGSLAYSATYRTPDSFDAVLAFYRGIAREYAMPGRPADHRVVLPAEIVAGPKGGEQIPSQVTIRQAFFILDGAPDLARSRRWLLIAEPIVGRMSAEKTGRGLRFSYQELQQLTAITYLEIRRK